MAFADIFVVVNPKNSINSMTQREIVDLYMGRYVAYPDGTAALPLDLPVDNRLRSAFYKILTRKSVAQINAYWAKLIFSGRATPPRIVQSSEDAIKIVTGNISAIAYVGEKDLTDDVKVIARLKTE